MLLGRSYNETLYRLFANTTLRWIIDQALSRSQHQDPISSGLVRTTNPHSLVGPSSDFFTWHAIRYWSEWLMMKDDVLTPWCHSWRKYVSCIPNVGLGDWEEWDAHFSVLIRNLYLEYGSSQFPGDLPPDVIQKFWTILWITYAQTQNIADVQSSLAAIQPVITKQVENGPFDLSILSRIDSVLQEMCEVNKIQWEGVRQPGWIQFSSFINHPMWEEPNVPVDWDTPFVILASAAAHKVEQQTIVEFLESMTEGIRERLDSIIKIVYGEPTELYEFWFPLENHQLEAGSEVSMGPSSKILGISQEIADKLTNSGGIGPRCI